jgi:succinoglycan biosynthesis transport protein ExoP
MKEPRELMREPLREATELTPTSAAGVYSQYGTYSTGRAFDTFQFLDYWRAIRKRLWLVAGIVVLFTTLAAIYMARKPSIYAANAIVQVDLEQVNPDVVTSDRQRPFSNPDPAYFNTQLQLLWSDSLLRRVVKEKNLDTTKEFQVSRNESSTSTWRSVLRSIGLASSDRDTAQHSQLPSDVAIASSDDVNEAVRLAPYVDIIHRNLDIEPIRESRSTIKDTRLIDITFRSTNPDLAAYVANGIAETFTMMNQEKRSGTSRKTNDFLQDRIASLQSDIQSDEEKLVNLTQTAGILKTGEGDQTIVIDRLSGLNKQLLDAENERKNTEANYLAVSNSPEKVDALAEQEMARYVTEQENNIRSLETDVFKKIADLKQERAKKLQDYKEGAPEIREIDARIKSYENSLEQGKAKFSKDLDDYRKHITGTVLQNLRTKYLQAKGQEDKVRADFDKQYAEAQGQNQSAVNLKLLQQNIDTNKGFLDNLRKQVSGNDVAAQGSDNNISVMEIAIPPDTPVAPRRLMTVAAAFLLSTLFGMGLALVLEYLDDTIRSTEEIESYLQLPALAAIPSIDSMPRRKLLLVGAEQGEEAPASPLLISADTRSSLAEAYRHLRTSILLSTAGHAPKSLLITSSLPSEGKTTTATNTAISLAQTGGRVLILDGDMRLPRLHSIFGIENNVGLSSILASDFDEDATMAAIEQHEKTKLFVLPSGPIPPNPAELLGSEQMSRLLGFLQTRFTHVVIDSPPIASFTDGVLIASIVDGVILVVNAGKSSRQVVRRSRQLLQDIGAKVFGVVLNNVNHDGHNDYYYYQRYYDRNTDARGGGDPGSA